MTKQRIKSIIASLVAVPLAISSLLIVPSASATEGGGCGDMTTGRNPNGKACVAANPSAIVPDGYVTMPTGTPATKCVAAVDLIRSDGSIASVGNYQPCSNLHIMGTSIPMQNGYWYPKLTVRPYGPVFAAGMYTVVGPQIYQTGL